MKPAELGVVIPAFNASSTIRETVSSAFRGGATRVLVVDDGSTDDTSIEASAAGADVIRQPNAGAAAARRRGAQEIDTEWTVLLDADDALIEEGVAHSVSILADQPFAVAAAGRVRMRFADGTTRWSTPWEAIDTARLLRVGHSPCPPAAVTWRTTALRVALRSEPPGLWPAFAEDYELLIRASLIGEIIPHHVHCAEYQAFGGKSDRHALTAAHSAIEIAEWYSALTGEYTPRRPRRGANAQVALRRATSRDRSPKSIAPALLYLGKAAVCDPLFVLRWTGQRFSGGPLLRSIGQSRQRSRSTQP